MIWLHQVTVPLYQETVPLFKLNQIQSKQCNAKLHFIRNSQLIHVHNIRDRNPKSMVYTDAFPKSNGRSKDFACLSTYWGFLWKELWSVSRYVKGRLSGRWRLCGNDQQCLAAPIWKYRSGFGDHRFTFFIDLFPNYTFYTNLTNNVYWVVVDRDVPHLITLNLGKVEKSMQNRLMPV